MLVVTEPHVDVLSQAGSGGGVVEEHPVCVLGFFRLQKLCELVFVELAERLVRALLRLSDGWFGTSHGDVCDVNLICPKVSK